MASPQINLSWKDHSYTLVSVFENLQKENTLVDCTLAAEGQYLKAHKIVLSAYSSYFELLFSQESEKNPIVILKDVEFQDLKAAVNFMYRGEVDICEDRLEALLDIANSLQIRGLQNDGKAQSSKEEASSSLLVDISSAETAATPLQHTREEALSAYSDSAVPSPHVPADCELVKRNDILSGCQPLNESSLPTLPLSTSFSRKEQDICSDPNILEKFQSSLTASPQFSSGENEQSDINAVLKKEPLTDIHGEENSEEPERSFGDDVTMIDVKEEWEEHNFDTETDEFSISQQDNVFTFERIKIEDDTSENAEEGQSENDHSLEGTECVAIPDIRHNQQSTGSSTQIYSLRSTSRRPISFGTSEESINSLLQPQERHERDAGKLVCLECHNSFSSSLALKKHVRLHASNRIHKCPYCEYTTKKLSRITSHFHTHVGERPYKCPHCTHWSCTKDNMKNHIRTHASEELFQCSECDYKSRCSSNMIVHRRKHTGEKPYQCPNCDFRSTYVSAVNRHRRSHNVEKPYQCTECDYKAISSSCLFTHLRKHHDEKPYKCFECDYKSNLSSNLTRHRRIHSGEKPYQCHECGYKSNDVSAMKRHRRVHSAR